MTSSDTEKKEKPSSEIGGRTGKYKDKSSSAWRRCVPHSIYFYYFVKKPAGGYDCEAYFLDNGQTPITKFRLKDKIIALAANARGNKRNPRPYDDKFGGRPGGEPWNRISWLVIAVDGDDFDANNAVEIEWIDGGDRKPNHSFFDGHDQLLELDDGSVISVMWTWNHMRDANGDILKDASQRQTFRFHFNPRREPIRADPDENGTNTGPTVAPPPRERRSRPRRSHTEAGSA